MRTHDKNRVLDRWDTSGGGTMYAIINKKTKKFVCGTDRRQFYPKTKTYKQITSLDQALTYEDIRFAEGDLTYRYMSKDYEVVEVELTVVNKGC